MDNGNINYKLIKTHIRSIETLGNKETFSLSFSKEAVQTLDSITFDMDVDNQEDQDVIESIQTEVMKVMKENGIKRTFG